MVPLAEKDIEDKKEIVERLKLLLVATRAGNGLEDLILNEEQDKVMMLYKNGLGRQVNIAADSGIAIIRDVLKVL